MSLAKRRREAGEVSTEDRRLRRWIREKWQNLTPKTLGDHRFYECGRKSSQQAQLHLPSVCRPTLKISKHTPRLAKTFSLKQIKRAVQIKKAGNRIEWGDLPR
jgi:hypothetical protein